ncbi:hypothetical protein pEaSNUABM11_00088 [Erwinia phage pEa_SNUABM_11]|nr:hypothetical protein pEaSNUABM11_00088 [Erwinia phage pEa_SNUABM_11]
MQTFKEHLQRALTQQQSYQQRVQALQRQPTQRNGNVLKGLGGDIIFNKS